MQLMFVVGFILVFAVTVVSGARTDAERVRNESGAMAAQLTVWHEAAVRRCTAPQGPTPPPWTPCTSNAVIPAADIRNHLLPGQRNNPMWTRSDPYVVSYRTGGGLVVTFLTQAFQDNSTPNRNFATVAAAMYASGRGEHSSYVGTMTSPGGFVPLMRPRVASSTLPEAIPLGSYGGAATIPTGSTVLASRL